MSSNMKTLSEIKAIYGEKIFETATAFGVNDFGKYRPNITFIVPKVFEGNPLEFRMDTPTTEMIRGMNLAFDGSVKVLFGDFWKSQKGGACFRPKAVEVAQHVLIKMSWGGAFNRDRGMYDAPEGALYYRRASSNGGGAGYDYLVFPVGFVRVVRDAEIDGDAPAIAPDFSARATEIRAKFLAFDREQAEKAAAAAKAKAEAEEKSRAAKAVLLPRIEAANARFAALGKPIVEIGDSSFKDGWYDRLYSEATVFEVERRVAQYEAEKTEEEHKRFAREAFQTKFEAFKPRLTALCLTIEYLDDRVRLAGDFSGHSYSDEGLTTFVASLDKREREAAEAKAKADAEMVYQVRKTEAVAAGLPADVRIWCRRGGATNVGDGWVIGPDGQDRGNTAWHNPRPRYSAEGDKIWEQILRGEVVLKWSKAYTAADHVFEVIHLPSEGLTEAQLERIAEIEQAISEEWDGRAGMSGKTFSPPVGDGWGLTPRRPQKPVVTPAVSCSSENVDDRWASLKNWGK